MCCDITYAVPVCEYLKLETNMQGIITKVRCSFLKAVRCMEEEHPAAGHCLSDCLPDFYMHQVLMGLVHG